jgi:lysophospholipase L1-like esterase
MATPPSPSPSPGRRRAGLLLVAGLVVGGIAAVLVAVLTGGWSAVPVLPAPTAAATSAPAPAPSPGATTAPTQAPVAVFLGDSYTQGFGAVPLERRWSSLVARDAGWTEVNQGLGGTGYVTTSNIFACGLDYCPTYVERVQEVIAADPDIVLISGGQNDRWLLPTDPDRVREAVDTTFEGIRNGLPNARIIAVGPSTAEPATEQIEALDEWVQAAAARVDADYVSLLDPVVIQPNMIALDGVHVTDAGYRAIADRVLTVALAD